MEEWLQAPLISDAEKKPGARPGLGSSESPAVK
jgi:hypothetical protein